MAGGSQKNADLPVRATTAIAMILVAGAALWLGGMVWTIFVLAVGVGVWFEWSTLCLLMFPPGARRTGWRYGGAVYCGIACALLLTLRDMPEGDLRVLLLVGGVVGTDVGAYFFGRAIGGPKIAPSISPSKTWAGLVGGMVGASTPFLVLAYTRYSESLQASEGGAFYTFFDWQSALTTGVLIAIIAQAGDFFESWMKRRAGVKDSGKVLPGHGGLFDRVDGLMAVCFVFGLVFLAGRLVSG